ncbi:MAG: SPOR domain-containing protein [Paludibacteraceae bacterium]|nr:SPOR domain-containing protein [Paludibacteraceae bacterium]
MTRKFFLLIGLMLCVSTLWAQTVETTSVPDSAALLATPEIISEMSGRVDASGQPLFSISVDKRVYRLINQEKHRSGARRAATMRGFRVQVFSSNNQRTAKPEAIQMESKMLNAFPNISTYRFFQAPFWKVRMGDFRTKDEAEALCVSIIKAFPQLRGDVYAVPDDITAQ